MALCPACSRRAPLKEVLGWRRDQHYHCRWCGARLLVDGKRFRLAAYAVAYLTVTIGVGSLLVFRGLGKMVLIVGIWLAASPLVFSSWLTLRYPGNSASGQGGVLRGQIQEDPPAEKAAP